MVVVQEVRTKWTKATRGAPLAGERKGLPQAFLLPTVECEYLFQAYLLEESKNYIPTIKELKQSTRTVQIKKLNDLILRMLDKHTLSVGLRDNPHSGQPKRYPINNVFQLKPGQFGRILNNARYASYHGQHYYEAVYNIAFGQTVNPDRFLHSAPDHELNLINHLF